MSYAKITLSDLEDQAPAFGMGDALQARFARQQLGVDSIGLASYDVKPGQRLGFGHRHKSMDEIYVVTGGSGRFKLGEELVDVAAGDTLYVEPQTWREWEAGPDGMQVLAFGTHAEGDDESEMDQGFWPA